MSKWDVYGKVTGNQFMGKFEAETEQEAIDKANAEKGGNFTVCHQCADLIEEAEVIADTAEKSDERAS